MLMRRRADLAHIELVAMTGYGQDGDRERSVRAGFNKHLVKSVDFDLVEQILLEIGSRRTK